MGYFVHNFIAQSTPDYSNGSGVRATTSLIYDREGNRKYLTQSERKAFLRAASEMPNDVRTFCVVLAYSGARLSEVLSLTPRDVDVPAQVVVFESLKKRRRGIYRAVPLPVAILYELERVFDVVAARQDPERADQRLWPWCRTTAWNYVKRAFGKAQVRGTQATPKGLRHAFAVGALQAGVPINLVRKWLGHARLSTTEIYADAIGSEEQAIASRYWSEF